MSTANGIAPAPAKLFNPAVVRGAVELFIEPGAVFEVRALNATFRRGSWAKTISGFFNNADAVVSELGRLDSASGVYIVANPVDPRLLARSANKLRETPKGESTSDKDIVRRRWLLIDVDACRPSGISASDEEHAAAVDLVREIDLHLHDCGWPDGMTSSSGNGAHLVYRVDLPTDDGGLIQRYLESLANRFNTDVCKVDTGVFNPSRIWKLTGTLACKGDSTPERPHRMAEFLEDLHTPQIVPVELLEGLASEAPRPEPKSSSNGTHNANGAAFDVAAFLSRNSFDVSEPAPWLSEKLGPGTRWAFRTSPLCDHGDDGPYIAQMDSGVIVAGCHHQSCGWKWQDLRAQFEPKPERTAHAEGNGRAAGNPYDRRTEPPIVAVSAVALAEQHPHLKRPIIDGLLRRQETTNIIAASKVGKSWLSYGLALSVGTGARWLDLFDTYSGRVLLIDNELHPETIAHRIPRVAEALGIRQADYADRLDVVTLRGRLRNVYGLETFVDQSAGQYDLIIVDAWYRMLPAKTSENDNAEIAQIYNLIDQYAATSGAAWAFIHHTSKGLQGEKAVTDVGAGAGSQSRAADTHLVLRPHETDGVVVLDAAVRSFPPIDPVSLRWDFPIWIADDSADPGKLRGRETQQERRQHDRDIEGIGQISKALDALEWATMSVLRRETGIGKARCERLVYMLCRDGDLKRRDAVVKGNSTSEYALTETNE